MRLRAIAAIPLLCVAACGQPAPGPRFDTRFRNEVTYPSLTPRYVLRLDFGDWNGIWAGLSDPQWRPVSAAELAKTPSLARFTAPFHDPARYYIRRGDTERLPVERIDFARCREADTFCQPGGPDYFSVYLVLDPTRLRANDKVTVFLIPPGQSGGPRPDTPASNEVTLPAIRRTRVSLEPSYVPSQELTNGKKRAVAHLDANISIDNIPLWRRFGRSYVRLENVLSTDAKDKSSKVEARWMALERALPGRWYLPLQVETKLVGNQAGDRLSHVSSAGVSGLIPWRWTRKAFYGELLQLPVSPIWKVAAQNEFRIRRDENKYPDRNAFRLFGEMSWAPIRLLPSSGADTLTVEALGRAWYYPSDRNTLQRKIARVEGYFEISLLVPLTKLQFEGAALVIDEKSKAKQRVRLKYSNGANEANSFLHSSQLSIGMEVIK